MTLQLSTVEFLDDNYGKKQMADGVLNTPLKKIFQLYFAERLMDNCLMYVL